MMATIPNLSTTATPIADAAAELIGPFGAFIVTLGALLSMAGTNSGTVLEGSRMLFALSLDRNLGPLSYVHPKYRTPSVAIIIHVVVATGLALGRSFAKLAMLSAVARLTTYLFTCAGIPFIQRKMTNALKPSTLILAILGTIISLALFFTLNTFNFIAAGIALGAGVLVYLISARRLLTPSA